MTAATAAAAAETGLLTDEQTAARLGRSKEWVQRQARKGLIGHTRIGKSYGFTEADIRNYLAANRKEPTTAPAPRRASVAGINPQTAARVRGRQSPRRT